MADGSSVKVDPTDLVSSLTKFMAWNDEYAEIREKYSPNDAAGNLMKVLGIPDGEVRCLIGGSNAPILKQAADEINELRTILYMAVVGDLHGLPNGKQRLNDALARCSDG